MPDEMGPECPGDPVGGATWEAMSPSERAAILESTRDKAFRYFLGRLRAAGRWMGLDKEAQALATLMETQRNERGT